MHCHPPLLLLFVYTLLLARPFLLGGTDAAVATTTSPLTLSVRVPAAPPPHPSNPATANPVGLSIEISEALHMMGPDGSSQPFAQALANLQAASGARLPLLLRLGGDSSDNSCYRPSPSATMPAGCKYNITNADLAAYHRFATATAVSSNVAYILGTNLGLSPNPDTVAMAHVQALGAHGLWPLVRAVEIGNECDQYDINGHRSPHYTYADYEAEFDDFSAAYAAQGGMPPGRIQGATYCCFLHPEFVEGVAAYVERFRSRLHSFSFHRYPLTRCLGLSATTAELLSSYAVQEQAVVFSPIVDQVTHAAAASNGSHIPFWIGEGNSVSCGGMPNVSDTFAAALWVVDFLPAMARIGVAGMNLHGGPHGAYPPIAFDPTTGAMQLRPLYYGLLLHSELVGSLNNTVWVDITRSGDDAHDLQTGAHAAWDVPAATLRIVVVDKHLDRAGKPAQPVRLCPGRANPPQTATLVRLTAPSVGAKYGDGVRYANQTFDNSPSGRPVGARVVETLALADDCYTFQLPPLSAVLVTVQFPTHATK